MCTNDVKVRNIKNTFQKKSIYNVTFRSILLFVNGLRSDVML